MVVPIALVTDSTAYLSAKERAAHRIGVVPLHVVIGGQEFSEGVDVTPAQVAEALRSFTPVSTSRPSPQAFADVYADAVADGASGIVSVHISADMSSTIGSAQLAAAQADVPVRVVDSRVLGGAMAYAVLAGVKAAAGGADLDEVAGVVEQRCAGAACFFYVDTLEYLRRGGRIGKASALLGSALAIKPILGLVDGHIVALEKVRTASRAIGRLEELAVDAIEQAADGADVVVHHLDAAQRADTLADRLSQRLGGRQRIGVVELGAVVGAHVGPGTLAVAVVPHVSVGPRARVGPNPSPG